MYVNFRLYDEDAMNHSQVASILIHRDHSVGIYNPYEVWYLKAEDRRVNHHFHGKVSTFLCDNPNANHPLHNEHI